MNLTKKRKISIGIAILFLVLIVTNPSVTAFKTYLGESSYYRLKRPLNLFIYSVYVYHKHMEDTKYIGIFGNFIEIKSPHPEDGSAINTSNIDTAQKDTSQAVTATNKDPLGILIRRKQP